ncbi:hypothetical protein D3C73_1560810 [compost metagenome]
MNKQRDHDKQRLGIHIGEPGFVLDINMRNIVLDQIKQQHTGDQPERQRNNS